MGNAKPQLLTVVPWLFFCLSRGATGSNKLASTLFTHAQHNTSWRDTRQVIFGLQLQDFNKYFA